MSVKRNYTLTKRTVKRSNGKVDTQNCVVVDMKNITNDEKQMVQMYVLAGYKVIKRRVPGNGVKKQQIIDYVENKGKKEQKEALEKIKDEKFMTIKKWFYEQFPAYDREMELIAEEEKKKKEQKKNDEIEKLEKEYADKENENADTKSKNNKANTKVIENA